MDAHHWTGSDERDLSATHTCQSCAVELTPDEVEAGTCRRCYGDYLANAGDDEAYEKEIA